MQAIIQFNVLDDISSHIIQAIIYFNVCEDMSYVGTTVYFQANKTIVN